ncbi:MAG: DUF4159 domain-containing protein [Gemmatimonadetes bacterium]|nr:DUF4159 domain-containing protein [Gemmatimonadota bacterium]MBT4608956.1 DUF4159 domain-containing protein [Gemmatimonadota bacterium]MBT5057316.1 DUF4159 domain-containing protein [Gemmatimonadota bacterium]MBT5145934.1 DUF4159 domain-containing protein [Gemmatimonadota bacterium]MBT5589930.1 DUF4159 domain-containing protein [Gemmatimonadota bacterium]
MSLSRGFLLLLIAGISACATLRNLEPREQIDEADTAPTPADFDTGQFGAVILEDPDDKQSIEGFVYLSITWGRRLRPGHLRAVSALAEALTAQTSVRAKLTGHTFLNSPELLRRPFVYISAVEAFDLSELELDNLGRYIRSGGFVVVDNGRPDLGFGPAEAALRQMLVDALDGNARFERIPNTHAIFHSYYDLQGPPFGGDYRPGLILEGPRAPQVDFLEGIFIDGRLVAVYADMGYGEFWQQSFENEPQLKMGINLVIYALTKEGSLAMKLKGAGI